MDSSLEEEIARLSRPPTAENAESVLSTPTTNYPRTEITHPQNGAAAQQRRHQDYSEPPPPPKSGNYQTEPPPGDYDRHQRRGSGSSAESLSRSGSAGRLGSSGGLRSPPRAAAVLAGRTISDLQLPVMPTGSQGLPEQPQLQRKGSAGSVGSAGGGAPNGRSRPRLAANGEKVAGPARPPPTANGEKVAGYAGGGGEGGRASPPTVPGALAKRLDVTVGRVKGDGKEQEAWKKSEEALKKKEQSVRNALKEKQRSLRQETQLLAHVDRELAQLALDHQMEVNDLRKSLEVVDRELAFMDRDAQKKLEAFEKARTMLSAKVTQKQGITARLTQLIMASEKKRDAKLNEIMKKMSVEEGGSVSGSAPNSGGASYM